MPKHIHTLEETLRILANAGELTHLSVITRAGKGRLGAIFSASYSPASKWGHGFGEDPDPVNAIMKAIGDERFKDLVKKLKIDTAELPMVIPTPLTAEELRRAAGGSAPERSDPPPAPAEEEFTTATPPADEEDEPWLRS